MCNEPFLPDGVNLEVLLQSLRYLSWGAADILKAYARGNQPPYGFPISLSVEEGGDGPVSAADLAVNTWLLDGLKSNFPKVDWILLSEETAKDQLIQGVPIDNEWLWVLDPLDGTKDFLQGSGEYAVHLALVRNNSPLIGVVLIPEKEELWFGVCGEGAWCEDRNEVRTPVRFSCRSDLSKLILVSSRNHRNERLEKLLFYLGFGGTKVVGSVGCKIATILRGESDLYISLSGQTSPKDWDMAAPHAVLKAAGGSFTHADGRELQYNSGDMCQRGCLIASQGHVHSEICQKVLLGIKSIDSDFEV